MCVSGLWMVFWLIIGFIELFNTQPWLHLKIAVAHRLVTVSSRRCFMVATSASRSNWITADHNSTYQVLWACCILISHYLVTGSNSVLCFHAHVLTICQLFHNWLSAPTVLLITSRHRPYRKHYSSVAFSFVGMPTWLLLSHYLATAVVYRVIT
jgi:hypothetical protein